VRRCLPGRGGNNENPELYAHSGSFGSFSSPLVVPVAPISNPQDSSRPRSSTCTFSALTDPVFCTLTAKLIGSLDITSVKSASKFLIITPLLVILFKGKTTRASVYTLPQTIIPSLAILFRKTATLVLKSTPLPTTPSPGIVFIIMTMMQFSLMTQATIPSAVTGSMIMAAGVQETSTEYILWIILILILFLLTTLQI